ncbi:hypothetical protein SNE40_009778 [Patella caerulea]|uniref:Uncharacterized protein n=1 Tax=Patella caerulea TaxID=87958 RepID=A0AAN8JT75_PATCE
MREQTYEENNQYYTEVEFDKTWNFETDIEDDPELHEIVSSVQTHSKKHSKSCKKKNTAMLTKKLSKVIWMLKVV